MGKYLNKPKITNKGIPYNYKKSNCKYCSIEYQPMTNVQKFCSQRCQERARRKRSKDKIYAYNSKYNKLNRDKVNKWNKKLLENPEYIIKRNKYRREYSKRDYVKEYRRNYKKKYSKKPNLKIAGNIRSRIFKKIKTYKKYGMVFTPKSERGININVIVNKLMLNLPSDYKEKKYHIDHIEPLCSFDLTDKEQFNKAFAPENHRWLLAEDNFKKISQDRSKSLKLLGK